MRSRASPIHAPKTVSPARAEGKEKAVAAVQVGAPRVAAIGVVKVEDNLSESGNRTMD